MKKQKYLFQLNHPAHFHLFKHTIEILEKKGHEILISIKDKDVLKELVKGRDYVQISDGNRKNNIFSIIFSIYKRDINLAKVVKQFKPDVMIGTSPEIGHISPFVRVPSIFLGEDDVKTAIPIYIGALTCYPLFGAILAPSSVDNGIWNKKTIRYQGFQKLAYLHPNHFKPDRSKVKVPEDTEYFLIRLVNFKAYHDINATGISNSIARQLIDTLLPNGQILISSERELPDEFKQYVFKGNKKDIHHYMYYAKLFIGDSQSMAVESAMLGTPNIRFNDFVGKINVLHELDNKYKLSVGLKTSEQEKLMEEVNKVLYETTRDTYKHLRDIMLSEKIDVTAFMVWFIENYPNSRKTMKKDPGYQDNFK